MRELLVSNLRCRMLCKISYALSVLLAVMVSHPAQADNFSRVSYDRRKDELVITMSYRGTNPDHAFALHWGSCKEAEGSGLREIVVDVLDSQWEDEERADFKKTTRYALTDVSCRPATLVLRTAPHFVYTLLIPAAALRQSK
jgi:hypothetical protein